MLFRSMGAVSFAESSFFPVPPDIMLIPMALARPERAYVMDGVTNVLKLRAQFEGGTPASPDKYLDLYYYQKARAGL